MKKLKLKLSGLSQSLTKEQMKKIIGADGTCLIYCCDANNQPLDNFNIDNCISEEYEDDFCNMQYQYPPSSSQQAYVCKGEDACGCQVY